MKVDRGTQTFPLLALTALAVPVAPAGTLVLTADSVSGELMFSVSGSPYAPIDGAAADPDTSVQFNSSGDFAGDALFVFDGTEVSAPALLVAGADNTVSYTERVGDPASAAAIGRTYAKDVSGTAELFYLDDAGGVVQITSGGALSITDIALVDNDNFAFLIHEGATNYLRISTQNGSQKLTFGDPTSPAGMVFNVSNSVGGNEFEIRDEDGNINLWEMNTGGGGGIWNATFGQSSALTPTYTFWTRGTVSTAFRVLDSGTGGAMLTMSTAGTGQATFGSTTPDVNVPVKLVGTATHLEIADRAADPTPVTASGQVYTKDISALTELFYQDDSGQVVQVTSNGSVVSGPSIPIVDNTVEAFHVFEGANDYFIATTTDGSESIILGNTTTNPSFVFNGDGPTIIGGTAGDLNYLQLRAHVGVPSGTPDFVDLVSVNVSAVPQLFVNQIQFTAGSGAASQIGSAIAADYTLTAVQVPSHTLAANGSATAANNNAVLSALITDLVAKRICSVP